MRYLLDEDLPTQAAVASRNLGLDAVSVHEIDRRGCTDEEQFEFALQERRIVVTRNRDDFARLLVAAFEAEVPSPGVLVVPRSVPNHNAAAIAHALHRWHAFHAEGDGPGPCVLDFLS